MAKHLLGIQDLSKEDLLYYLKSAQNFIEVSLRDIKKVPSLRGKTIVNLFLEPSTRTRTSFEIAGNRLSADVVTINGVDSSVNKGETLLDTVQTLAAMSPDILVIRHKESGCAKFLARHIPNLSIVNAGDGMHEHPTQALLDCLTLEQHFAEKIHGKLTIAIVGDILHSRVARSNIYAHGLLGNKIRLIGPPTLLPEYFGSKECLGHNLSGKQQIEIFHNLKEGLKGVDVVMCLRMQLERQDSFFVPTIGDYSREFRINQSHIDSICPEAVLFHPGPVNRGVEVSSNVAYGDNSLVNKQVANGIALRMAVLFNLASGNRAQEI